jgi:hypothetical protein
MGRDLVLILLTGPARRTATRRARAPRLVTRTDDGWAEKKAIHSALARGRMSRRRRQAPVLLGPALLDEHRTGTGEANHHWQSVSQD